MATLFPRSGATRRQFRLAARVDELLSASEDSGDPHLVIFSKDRASQLVSLLQSVQYMSGSSAEISVFYRATSDLHLAAYYLAKNYLNGQRISWFEQREKASFRSQLLEIIEMSPSSRTMFLTDDMLFVERVNLRLIACLSTRWSLPMIRVGLNTVDSYTTNSHVPLPSTLHVRQVRLPEIADSPAEFLVFWEIGPHGPLWNFPVSTDGHTYPTDLLLELLRSTDFDSPNSLEVAAQTHARKFRGNLGIAYLKSRAINIPLNRVQNDYRNKSLNVGVDWLAERWLSGLRIRHEDYYGIWNHSPHMELDIRLTDGHAELPKTVDFRL